MKDSQEPAATSDEQLSKAQRTLDRAQKAQPSNAAIGALAGGIATEAVAVGAFYAVLFSEMSKIAKRMGKSVLDTKDPKVMQELTHAIAHDSKVSGVLKPLFWSMIAAPFVGSAAGAWWATRHGNQSIEQKRALLDAAQETSWQERLAAQSQAKHKGTDEVSLS